MSEKHFNIDLKLWNIAEEIEKELRNKNFNEIEKIAEYNQLKVIQAMQDNRVSEACFYGTTGYGYDDLGREVIDSIYSQVFDSEDALVRSQFISGTHALNTALWSALRPGDVLLSVTGKPYDTLEKAIGISGNYNGSLADFGVEFNQISLLEDGGIDYKTLKQTICKKKIKMVYIQRSKGYGWRPSLYVSDIKKLIEFVKALDKDIVCLIDNCYGEFVEKIEPTGVGAELVVGSLIKNPGGGIARTGAYIAGKKEYVELSASRLTAPGIGKECGATLGMNREIIMGLFFAPHIVAESLKGAVFCSELLSQLGFEVSPTAAEIRTDIIQAIKFNNKDALIAFCQGIQKGAAVDSHVTPQPWDMPGYSNQVIMAAGTFVQGASIEMSADAPIRSPYIAYLQGGLTYVHAKFSILKAVQELIERKIIIL
ncbi:MAG: aminotransferase class I/II-fold pyridoxal phosphate-dependent enzyme [Deltaproteobacteria bacterium]